MENLKTLYDGTVHVTGLKKTMQKLKVRKIEIQKSGTQSVTNNKQFEQMFIFSQIRAVAKTRTKREKAGWALAC